MLMKSLIRVALLIICVNCFAGAQGAEGDRHARIAQLFNGARAAEAARDFQTAIAYYDRILAIDPALAEVWANRGLVLYGLSRHKEALQAFEKACALKPGLLSAQLFLGMERLRLGAPEKAIAPLRMVTESTPDQTEAWYELSEAYAQSGQFEAAVETNARVLQSDPALHTATFQLGTIYLQWSKALAREIVNSPQAGAYSTLLRAEMEEVATFFPAAENHFNKAVAQQPDDVALHIALARFYLRRASPEYLQKAEAELQFAIAKEPLDPEISAQLARLAIVRKQNPVALALLGCIVAADRAFGKRVLSELSDEFGTLTPGLDSPSQEASASCHLTSYGQTAAQLIAAQDSRPLTAGENLLLSQSKWQLGEYTQALNALLKVTNQDPANFAARYWLYLTTQALARQTLQAAVDRDPGSSRAHLLVADMARQTGDPAKAEAEYRKAADTGAPDPEVLLIYIQYLRSISEDARAIGHARAALAKFPSEPKLNLELGRLMLKTGDAKLAVGCFEKSLAADPELLPARIGLADSYAAIGLMNRAITEIKPALHTDRDGSLYYRIARWYQQTGQKSEAAQAFTTTTKLKNEAIKRDIGKFALSEGASH